MKVCRCVNRNGLRYLTNGSPKKKKKNCWLL